MKFSLTIRVVFLYQIGRSNTFKEFAIIMLENNRLKYGSRIKNFAFFS